MDQNTTPNSSEATPSEHAAEKKTDEHQNTSVVAAAPSDSGAPTSEELLTETGNSKRQKYQGYKKPRKLYQALGRVEASLKLKEDELVLITKGDKTEFLVSQIGGSYTATRLLKRAANRRQGFYSIYPGQKAVKINNFHTEPAADDLSTPQVDQMFVSGKLASKEADAFFVDIGRNRYTYRAKQKIVMPLKIEGLEADPEWKLGQWIGLILHRQGTQWVWRGDTKAVLKSGEFQKKDKKDQDAEPAQTP